MDYIRINNTIKTDEIEGVELLSYRLPSFIAPAYRPSENAEKLLKRQGKTQYKEQSLTITLAVIADSLPLSYEKAMELSQKLNTAECVEISEIPGVFFRGYSQELRLTEQEDKWVTLDLIFNLNPPCPCRLLGSAEKMLLPSKLPLCEQITENNASYNLLVKKTEKLNLKKTGYPIEIYMMLIGSWDSLKIGQLELPGVSNQIVYIDLEAEQVYLKLDSKRTNLANLKGKFEFLDFENAINFSGENLNLTAHIYAVERV